MTTASSDPVTAATPSSELSQSNLLHGNISPTLRTFTDTAYAPAALHRILPHVQHTHHELESHSHKILDSTDPDEQIRFQNQFTWEIARHLIGEELVIYPAISEKLKDGRARVEKGRREHQEIRKQLKSFQELSPTDPKFAPTLKVLIKDLSNHMEQEEKEDLAILEDSLSQADSEALSRSINRTKMFAPSRSHPLSPSKQPFETAASLLMAPMDKVADIFRKWPHRSDGEREEA
ncbi:hypothetical protein N7474_004184 [Penicillium riverlandense]|uniref:uncharacterized protein n=1 Tax=Penicillium riverlandense TaxID=1903569 RepID=UPI0025499000|nr:uncharacterized protein N7474_004184 [Penicillium riverlandense]KAJ5818593.1 hypothetical protein N7474_004184 [Penicillium riverlandense]